MSPGRQGMLLMAVVAVAWSGVEALAAHALQGYSPYQTVWTRYAVHVGLMLLVWGWREPGSLWRTDRPAFQVARSLLMFAMPVSWVVAARHGVDSATLLAVFWVSPLLVIAFSGIFLSERAPAAVWVVGALGCAAAWLALRPAHLSSWQSWLFPLLAALSFSLYVVMTRSLRGETGRVNLFYTALVVLLALTPAMPAVWIPPSPADLAAFVGVGLLGYLVLLALDRAAAATPVFMLAPFAYLQLVAALGLAWGMGQGRPGTETAIAVVLIAAIALFMWMRDASLLRPCDAGES